MPPMAFVDSCDMIIVSFELKKGKAFLISSGERHHFEWELFAKREYANLIDFEGSLYLIRVLP